jgi:hypothetical protein
MRADQQRAIELHADPIPLSAPPPPRPTVVTPLAQTRYRMQVTVSADAHEHLRRAQGLLRHVILNGDPALVVERALKLLVSNWSGRHAHRRHARARRTRLGPARATCPRP